VDSRRKLSGNRYFTEGNDLEEVRANIRDAVDCHFDPEQKPKIIRLHFVSEEILAAGDCLAIFPELTL